MLLILGLSAYAQSPTELFREMKWRLIGPHRGGRTVAAVGVPGRPGVFYMGVNNGGVWKSDDYGRVWRPIFDDQPTGSIGAIAVAASNPDVVYVGSGEGLQRPDLATGDGIYRSDDSGKSWTHLGLRDGQQIPAIVVDPHDPNRLFVAVLGHPYGPNPERGIFRSTDGGRHFTRVLFKDQDTGAIDVAFEPGRPNVLYAALWQARQGPWENAAFRGPSSGLYKSEDGGTTWRPLTQGLPGASDGLGRIGLATCASQPKRLYAVVGASKLGGVYRSDDGGEAWRRVNDDPRLWGRDGDFNEIKADPKNADVVYVANVASWKSTDGGQTFGGLRGAPGGDDYHRFWIHPEDPRVMILAGDQGAVVTVNGGETWSSWYNQPTGQFYHVSTDNAFPYRVCGGQQESGSACVSSRGAWGQVTVRDWHTVGVEEYGYVAPDPLDPDVLYGGRLTRFDRRTGQVQNVAPKALRGDDYRVLRTAPVLFSPLDPHLLFFASERLWQTRDGGRTWEAISPDLSRATWSLPPSVGAYAATPAAQPTRRGVIYTVAPSPLEAGRLWAGTDDGAIHVTSDGGKTWKDVTPNGLEPWSKISLLEASHFDPLEAYAAVNSFRLDDLRPHVYRTRDGGTTWEHVSQGLPDGGVVNAVREDPRRRGLLFAGTEQAAYVSFDDGDNWQSLRLNMPATSVRDLVIKDDDLVVATHGRSFWVLDDIAPLRQLDPGAPPAADKLLQPATAWRVRNNVNTDTPMPADEPRAANPPDGAILHYFLKEPASGPVVLEIVDRAGLPVRRFSSEDAPEPPVAGRNIPDYWIRPPQRLGTAAGLHRFVWDLRHPAPPVLEYEYPIAAAYADTPREPRGPLVLPGDYQLRLTVGGRTDTQTLTVRMDPRVRTSSGDLRDQFAQSMRVVLAMGRVREMLDRVGTRGGSDEPAHQLLKDLASLYEILQGADAAPTPQAVAAVDDLERRMAALLED
ncbi:MAG TPA: glycoside hydrolase [Thermoleophilia bacterium]|nr:glycoside hydrolase [Thermoleophilia bacterium]